MPTPSFSLREKWLSVYLGALAEEAHWTSEDASQAASKAGLTEAEQALAAPAGVVDLIDHLFDQAAELTQKQASETCLDAYRTHQQIERLIRIWLEALAPNRLAIEKALRHGLVPWQAGPGLGRVWKTSDMIWNLAGDTATDYNHYSKRLLLSAAMPPILFYWCSEPSDSQLEVFITRQLKRAMWAGRTGSNSLKLLIKTFGSNIKKD